MSAITPKATMERSIWKRRRRATHVTPTLGLADDRLGLCWIGYADGEVLPPPPCPRPAIPRRPRARRAMRRRIQRFPGRDRARRARPGRIARGHRPGL